MAWSKTYEPFDTTCDAEALWAAPVDPEAHALQLPAVAVALRDAQAHPATSVTTAESTSADRTRGSGAMLVVILRPC